MCDRDPDSRSPGRRAEPRPRGSRVSTRGHSRGRVWVLALTTGLLLTGTDLRLAAQELPGGRCFDLRLGPWRGTGPLAEDSLTFAPPPRVYLDTSMAGRGAIAAGMRLREAPGSIPSVHPFSYWQSNRDSIELVWSTGFAGLTARLPLGSDSLHGLVKTFSDGVHAPQLEAPISAIHVACDEEPPIPVDAQRPVPTGVTLRSGGRVNLGQDLDSIGGIEIEPDGRTATLSEPLGRPFFGVRGVQLIADAEGRVGILRFRLPDPDAWSGLVRAITTEYGPPTSRSSQERDDIESETLDWANRSTSFSIHRSRGVGEAWHASIVIVNQRFRP